MNDEIRRLKRFIIISWTLLVIVLVGLVVWGSIYVRKFNDQIQLAVDKPPVIIKGIDGRPGAQGLPGISIIGPAGPQGLQGIQGQPGQSVTATEIVDAVTAYLQANPVVGLTGPQGSAGQDGRTLQVQVDSSCQLEDKYTDDDIWTVLAQLPKPCNQS